MKIPILDKIEWKRYTIQERIEFARTSYPIWVQAVSVAMSQIEQPSLVPENNFFGVEIPDPVWQGKEEELKKNGIEIEKLVWTLFVRKVIIPKGLFFERDARAKRLFVAFQNPKDAFLFAQYYIQQRNIKNADEYVKKWVGVNRRAEEIKHIVFQKVFKLYGLEYEF